MLTNFGHGSGNSLRLHLQRDKDAKERLVNMDELEEIASMGTRG
jgi:hypothetical protein